MPESPTPRLEMGGQAVIEGVLMRTQHGYSVAVRRASGAITIRSVPFRSLGARYKALKLPFLRGGLALFEMMAIGIKALGFSAEQAERDAQQKNPHDNNAAGNAPPPANPSNSSSSPSQSSQSPQSPQSSQSPQSQSSQSQSSQSQSPQDSPGASEPESSMKETLPQDAVSAWSSWAMAGVFTFSMAIAVVMMIILPNLLTAGVGRLLPLDSSSVAVHKGLAEEHHPLLFNLISGGFRALILIGYILLISRMQDIRRVFEYHGAEHKAVYAFESGCDLTVPHAQKFTTLHPRCGTSFLVVVVAVSIVIFAFVAWAYAAAWPGFVSLPFLAKKGLIFLGHLIALPLVASVSYEFLKFSSRRSDRPGWRWLIWPGLQIQKITTRPPDDGEVDVALAALKAALQIRPDQVEEQITDIAPSPNPNPMGISDPAREPAVG